MRPLDWVLAGVAVVALIWLLARIPRFRRWRGPVQPVLFPDLELAPAEAAPWVEIEARVWPSRALRLGKPEARNACFVPLSALGAQAPPDAPRIYMMIAVDEPWSIEGDAVSIRGHWSEGGFAGRPMHALRNRLRPVDPKAPAPAEGARALVPTDREPGAWVKQQVILSVCVALFGVGLVALTVWAMPDAWRAMIERNLTGG